ncbi:MAG TPA: hypothetical protein VGM10_11280 [Actinocrinis sp.]|jgi:hypothetical protein
MAIKSRPRPHGGDAAPEEASGPTQPQVSRRAALLGGLGVTALVALPDMLLGPAASAAQLPGGAAAAGTSPAAPAGFFFLYGTTGVTTPAGVEGWQAPAARAQTSLGAAPQVATTSLDAAPVKSPDGSTLALVSTGATGSTATVALTLLDASSGARLGGGSLTLPGVSADASVLVTPVFAQTATVALVIAASEPSIPLAKLKLGQPLVWTTTHFTAYFDRASGAIAGPFRLFDEPYLALTDAVADADHLYLWAIKDYTKNRVSKNGPKSTLTPEFFAIPLGSGSPALNSASAGPWPSGDRAHLLSNGDVARVIAGRGLETFTPNSGALTKRTIAALEPLGSAKPGSITLDTLPAGHTLITNSAFGRAAIVDPAASYGAVSSIDYPKVKYPIRGTTPSADGTTLYTLGAANTGGLNAYSIATGKLTASYSHGDAYAGVYQLASGTVLAVKPGVQSTLGFFSPQLDNLGGATTSVFVASVF